MYIIHVRICETHRALRITDFVNVKVQFTRIISTLSTSHMCKTFRSTHEGACEAEARITYSREDILGVDLHAEAVTVAAHLLTEVQHALELLEVDARRQRRLGDLLVVDRRFGLVDRHRVLARHRLQQADDTQTDDQHSYVTHCVYVWACHKCDVYS